MGMGLTLGHDIIVFATAIIQEMMVPLFLLVLAVLFRRALRTRRTVL